VAELGRTKRQSLRRQVTNPVTRGDIVSTTAVTHDLRSSAENITPGVTTTTETTSTAGGHEKENRAAPPARDLLHPPHYL
jgi:hypothetical protein